MIKKIVVNVNLTVVGRLLEKKIFSPECTPPKKKKKKKLVGPNQHFFKVGLINIFLCSEVLFKIRKTTRLFIKIYM